jgi:hydrogenase-4 component B
MVALAGLCVALGLAPAVLAPALSRAVAGWDPRWVGALPAPVAVLGAVHATLAGVLVVAGALVWRRVRARGLRRGPTWDCGYAAPTARMQYTGGSFAGIAAGWFAWILRPVRTARRPRGTFPTAAMRLERYPETVLDRVVAPVGAGLLAVYAVVRRLQRGRTQAYILYVLAALGGIGALVLLRGAS